MADKLDEPEFWLPSEFLTDEDILMDNKENVSKFLGLCFPTDLPYDHGSSVLKSPVESVVGSSETESDEEDLLLTGLTRQLSLNENQKLTPTHQNHEKARVLSGSPQSTLIQVGSWSGRSTISSNGSPNGHSQVSSPPTTPLGVNNDPWDLIYQAAGQVARLKMNAGGGEGPTRNPGLLGPPRRFTTPPPPLRNSSPSAIYHPQFQQQKAREEQMVKQETNGIWSRQVKNGWSYESQDVLQNMGGRIGMGFGSGGGMRQMSCGWPSQQQGQQRNQQQHYGELGLNGRVYSGCGYGYGFGYGSGGGGVGGGGGCGGLKRERAGTGVFLPRRYDNNSLKVSESRKKPGCSAAWLPNKVSEASNKNFGDIRAIVEHKSQYNGGFIRDYDAVLARRNALLAQQRRSLCPEGSISHEICLPQEWTY